MDWNLKLSDVPLWWELRIAGFNYREIVALIGISEEAKKQIVELELLNKKLERAKESLIQQVTELRQELEEMKSTPRIPSPEDVKTLAEAVQRISTLAGHNLDLQSNEMKLLGRVSDLEQSLRRQDDNVVALLRKIETVSSILTG